MMIKRRYNDPAHPSYKLVNSWAHRVNGYRVAYLVFNLFELHRWERNHPRSIVQTSRYRAWLAKREQQEPAQ